MRTVVFLIGIGLVILGPLVTLTALSSCLGTILSGHLLACVTDFVYVVLGGMLFIVGVITSIIGVVIPDPTQRAPDQPAAANSLQPVETAQITCKKCGRVYSSGNFFCPSCGQRPS
jgi:hypothetical protein